MGVISAERLQISVSLNIKKRLKFSLENQCNGKALEKMIREKFVIIVIFRRVTPFFGFMCSLFVKVLRVISSYFQVFKSILYKVNKIMPSIIQSLRINSDRLANKSPKLRLL